MVSVVTVVNLNSAAIWWLQMSCCHRWATTLLQTERNRVPQNFYIEFLTVAHLSRDLVLYVVRTPDVIPILFSPSARLELKNLMFVEHSVRHTIRSMINTFDLGPTIVVWIYSIYFDICHRWDINILHVLKLTNSQL